METKDQIKELFDSYFANEEKFAKGVKAAGTRARKDLMVIAKLCKVRRAEIQDAKNNN